MDSDLQAGAGRDARKGGRALAAVVWCGVASLLLYLLAPELVALLNSSAPSFAHEVFPWVKHYDATALTRLQAIFEDDQCDAWFLIFMVALFAVYGVAMRAAKTCEDARAGRLIFAGGAVFLGLLAFSPVMLSTDVFAYSFYGRTLSVYGANPYDFNRHIADDPFLTLFNSQCIVSMYGPFWTLISGAVTRVTGTHVGLTVLAFRLIATASTLGTGGLIWKCLRIHAPERAAQGLALFLWNPLVILEAGMSGHNDATMAALALLGVWLHLRGRKTAAVAAFTLSALVKFITGMFIPLYVLMVLRGMGSWRERGLFLARSGVCAGVLAAGVFFTARVNTNVPAESQALATDFYNNNFHELILARLRRAFGDDADAVEVPIHFGSWWASLSADEQMWDGDEGDGNLIGRVAKGAKVLVISPDLTGCLRVYDPVSHKKGYIADDAVDYIADQGQFKHDPALNQLEDEPADWATVRRANAWIRVVTWALFAVFGLLAAWKTRDTEGFITWAGAALLVSYYTVMTQIWPWYIVWALAFGALRPGNAVARLSVWLSIGMMSLYVWLGYANGDQPWICTYRSLPTVVLPLAAFAVVTLWSRRRMRQGAEEKAEVGDQQPEVGIAA